MADLFVKGLYKLRFLFVGALVLTLLSAPFMTNAGTSKISTAEVLEVSDTIAGLSTDIIISGDKYSPVEVAITKPNGKTLMLEAITDASGNANLNLDDYHVREAGNYSVEVRHLDKNESYSPNMNFEVYPGTVSETRSKVEFSKNTAELGETTILTVKLTDEYGNAIKGHVLKLMTGENSVTSYSPEFATDKEGEMEFYVVGNEKGIVEFTVFDSSTNNTLTEKPKLAFLDTNSSYKEIGGWSNPYTSVLLASESGSIDSFRIDNVENEVGEGSPFSLTIVAIDENGLTVSDYTGEIRFSSDDSKAKLPNDYTFESDDLGEHNFDLGFELLTQGTQTITVNDTDSSTIEGSIEIEVISEGDYNNDFVTDDYESNGDFTLASPASGTYSSSTLEVQGEGEYGYNIIVYINDEEAGRSEIEVDNSFTYEVKDLEDGEYEIYVEIVELGDGNEGEEEILEVLETSDLETVTIDTSAPELTSVSTDAGDNEAEAESVVTVTVLTETNLEEASVLFNDELYKLDESITAGKYQGEIVMPKETGEYTLDVLLTDNLGNEVQYRDQLTLTVVEITEDQNKEIVDEVQKVIGIDTVTGITTTPDEKTIIISWETPESENSIAYYRVYYGPSSDELFAISDTDDSSTSWIITDLEAEELYYFAVSAVDVEGEEGPQSDIVLGVPKVGTTEKTISEDEKVPTGEEAPEISSTETPDETPDSGPTSTAMLLISGLGSIAYIRIRKRA